MGSCIFIIPLLFSFVLTKSIPMCISCCAMLSHSFMVFSLSLSHLDANNHRACWCADKEWVHSTTTTYFHNVAKYVSSCSMLYIFIRYCFLVKYISSYLSYILPNHRCVRNLFIRELYLITLNCWFLYNYLIRLIYRIWLIVFNKIQ